MTGKRLLVWFESAPVGSLEQLADGRHRFTYAADWLANPGRFAISLSLPLREEPYADRPTRAFFGGLLPDDEARRRLAKYLHVSARNEFALLAEVGRECAGALALLPPDETPAPHGSGSLRRLTDRELAGMLRELPVRPLLAGGELRLSLAGAQDKIAVQLVDGAIALPLGGLPTTHILKVPIANYAETVANEHFCMQLARAAGLTAPATEIRQIENTPVLLVERYDRTRGADGNLHRLHQEDFCQALGIPPELKYQSEGGPGLPQLFATLTAHSTRAAVDRLDLLRMVVFHFLIGNADAHAKNFSLFHAPRLTRMAPVYDAMCTVIYPALSQRLAMKVDSKYEFDAVAISHWTKFARTVGLAPPVVLARLRELASELPDAAQRLAAELPEIAGSPTVRRIVEAITARCAAVLAQAKGA